MPRRPDIIVIGAGIIGCATAYELVRRGASVHVVDARSAGMGATQAAAGMLAPHLEVRSDSAFLDLAVRSLALFDDYILNLQADAGVSIRYRRTGTLQVAMTEQGMDEMRHAAAELDTRAVPYRLLNAGEARIEEPHLSDAVRGGLVVPTHGFVSGTDLVQALAAGARRHGAEFIERRRVHRVSSSDGALTVEIDGGSLSGSAGVLAAGSWCAGIEIGGVPSVPVRPVRGQLLRLAWNGPPLGRIVWSEHCYLVPWDAGTLLVGATVEDVGFDERTTVAGVRELLEAACEVIPAARAAGFVEARAGLRPASGDLLPIVGPSRVIPNLMYATAHYRNGILLAPLTAKLVADALLENRFDPALRTLAPQRYGEL
jgi:glycine oxidase